ncbi:MAG: hypothetical protein F6K16_16380 [Symploca sp. SIO2B6]|nr:hypothetical protein [Symploca sp. SIO2B6]
MTINTALLQEIQDYLTDASDQQVQCFATEVERLKQLQEFFNKYPEECKRFPELIRAEKALDYKRPYRIAVIGVTGAGKSTFINALLGQELVLTRAAGKAATGTVLEIFLDASDEEDQIASVEYRDKANIRKLVDNFIQCYKPGAKFKGNLDTNLANALKQFEPEQRLTTAKNFRSVEFERLRDTLAGIVMQYHNHERSIGSFRRDFSLTNPVEKEELKNLTDENSNLNSPNSTTRIIGLVKKVTYRLKPMESDFVTDTFQLPKNVCLVDLPGLDGSPLHNIIIREGIKDADAAIYIKGPKRIDTDDDVDLLSNIREYIHVEGNVESSEGVFFVLNARDSITEDKVPANLAKDMHDLIENFLPGYTSHPSLSNRGGEGKPYFLISALAALEAQKALTNQPLENPNNYESLKLKLDVRNGSDDDLLKASQVPTLIDKLTLFARDYRIEGQIRDGKTVIDKIFESLDIGYREEQSQLTRIGVYSSQNQVNTVLQEKQQELENTLRKFRGNILENDLKEWHNQLTIDAQNICQAIDNSLKEKMPNLWKKSSCEDIHAPDVRRTFQILEKQFVGGIEVNLWHQFTFKVPVLAKHLVQLYTEAINTQKVAHQINENCLGYLDLAAIQSSLNDWIEKEMSVTMQKVSKYIALTIITDSEKWGLLKLTSNSEKIKQSIEKIPKQPDVTNLAHFEPLITTVREHYQPIVSDFCIKALLNLFKYEMFLIEQRLFDLINQTFEEIRSNSNKHPGVRTKIMALIKSDPEWKRMELVERKLADLNFICGKAETNH